MVGCFDTIAATLINQIKDRGLFEAAFEFWLLEAMQRGRGSVAGGHVRPSRPKKS